MGGQAGISAERAEPAGSGAAAWAGAAAGAAGWGGWTSWGGWTYWAGGAEGAFVAQETAAPSAIMDRTVSARCRADDLIVRVKCRRVILIPYFFSPD